MVRVVPAVHDISVSKSRAATSFVVMAVTDMKLLDVEGVLNVEDVLIMNVVLW